MVRDKSSSGRAVLLAAQKSAEHKIKMVDEGILRVNSEYHLNIPPTALLADRLMGQMLLGIR